MKKLAACFLISLLCLTPFSQAGMMDSPASGIFGKSLGAGVQRSNQNKTTLQKLQALGGLTFYKDFTTGSSLDADFSVGSPTATYASTSGTPTLTGGYNSMVSNLDILKYPVLGNRTKNTETIVVEFTCLVADFANDGVARYIVTNDVVTASHARIIAKDTAGAPISFYPNIADAGASRSTTIPKVNGDYLVAALSYGTTADANSRIYVSGFTENTDSTNYTSPNWGTYFYVGVKADGTKQLNGIIKRIAIFNRALTESELDNFPFQGDRRKFITTNYVAPEPTYVQAVAEVDALLGYGNTGWSEVIFGQSEQGRDIRGIIITPTSYTKTVLITGGHHGSGTPFDASWDESVGVASVLGLLNYYHLNPSKIPPYRMILCPVLNPDGAVAGTRKNNNTNDGRAVDINRNFITGWGGAATAPFGAPSSDPASQNYMGPAADSEAETLVFKSIITTYTPDLHIDVHATWDRIAATAALTDALQTTVNSYFTKYGYNAFSQSFVGVATPMGLWTDYAYSQGVPSYYLELVNTNNRVQVNRFIAGMQFLVEEGI